MSSADSGNLRTTFERIADWMVRAGIAERIAISAAATVSALLLGIAIVALAGYSPLAFVNDMLYGMFGTGRRSRITLQESSFYILAGVAVAVAFRAGVFNIGVQGQFIVAMLATTMSVLWTAPMVPDGLISSVVLVFIGITAGIVAGGLYGAFPGVLKAYADANEIITTIMLNFIAIGVVFYLVDGPFKAEGVQNTQTATVPSETHIPLFIGLLATLVATVLMYVLLSRTKLGYDMVTSGHQQSAANYSGVKAKQTIVGTMTLSGMVSGFFGAMFIFMKSHTTRSPGGIGNYGFDAIAVSLLAGNHPLGVIPAGLLFGGLTSGGNYISVASDIPQVLIGGIIGLVVLFVATPELFRMAAIRSDQGGEEK